jgi:hypothetical protein
MKSTEKRGEKALRGTHARRKLKIDSYTFHSFGRRTNKKKENKNQAVVEH